MLQKWEIQDSGDTVLLKGENVDKAEFDEANAKAIARGDRCAGEVGARQVSVLKERGNALGAGLDGGVPKCRSAERCSDEIPAGDHCAREIRAVEVGSREVRCLERPAREILTRKIAAGTDERAALRGRAPCPCSESEGGSPRDVPDACSVSHVPFPLSRMFVRFG